MLVQGKKVRVLAGNKGFSLVELMVVVAIITILAGLAIPKFRNFQAKARQAEAKTNLSHIFTLQESFYADANAYFPIGDKGTGTKLAISATAFDNPAACRTANSLGFYISDCTRVRYLYEVENAGDNLNEFDAAATELGDTNDGTRRVFPDCTEDLDQWVIDEDKFLQPGGDLGPTGALGACAG